MQAGGAAQGVGTIPGRRRLNALLTIAAVLVVAAVLALAVWVVPLATSGVGTEEDVPKAGAGSALILDDAGNVNPR
jgi:cytosine/uracil/thiamine/allantoin permease